MGTFSIVFICSGNRFRSPLAAAFVRQLTLGLPLEVESFGTLELGNSPALPEACQIGLACGLDLADHRTRTLGPETAAHADLVLGFEPEHARYAVLYAGARRERSFMLREFLSLLEGLEPADTNDPVARAKEAVAAASTRRASMPGGPTESIADPIGKPWKVYRETADEIRALTITLAEVLFGVIDAPSRLPEPDAQLWPNAANAAAFVRKR